MPCVHACLHDKSVPTFHIYVPTCQRRAIFQICVPTCQKAWQFFNYFSKEKIFQLWLTFANFKNISVILENLSRETKNLNFDICLFLLTCYKLVSLLLLIMHTTNLVEKAYIMLDDYETTLETTVLENIVIRNGKKPRKLEETRSQ